MSEPVIRELISAERIQARVRELGQQLAATTTDAPLVLLVILKGSFMFAADLARAIDRPLSIEFLGVASYGDGIESSGAVQITHDLGAPIEGKDVVLIEDIVDTGLTLDYLLRVLAARRPSRLRVCTLLEKPARREHSNPLDLVGFEIGDEFVVGYGLDWAQKYRNLPFIGVVEDAGPTT